VKYARIVNGAVSEVYDVKDPSQLARYYDPSVAVTIVAMSDEADVGWVYSGGTFLPPCPGPYYSIQNGSWVEDVAAAQTASITARLAELDKKCSREAEDGNVDSVMAAVVDSTTTPPTTRAMMAAQKQALRAQLREITQ